MLLSSHKACLMCFMHLYLARVLSPVWRSGTDHIWCDPAPVIISAVRYYSHIHSTQHRGEGVAVNLCHAPAAHCAEVTHSRGVFIRQRDRLDVSIQLCCSAELQHKPKAGCRIRTKQSERFTSTSFIYLNNHEVVVIRPVIIIVYKYL